MFVSVFKKGAAHTRRRTAPHRIAKAMMDGGTPGACRRRNWVQRITMVSRREADGLTCRDCKTVLAVQAGIKPLKRNRSFPI
jgi:hypothetical protein